MLQSEFYEMTKVNLTPEEYKKIEEVYDSCQMDKNSFCKVWKENRDNEGVCQLISELMDTIRKLEDDVRKQRDDCEAITSEMEDMKSLHKAELENENLVSRDKIKNFARKMVVYMDDETNLYEAIENEFGQDYIIQVKLEEDMDLNKEERDYLINMLK